jgi:hypothetical protein
MPVVANALSVDVVPVTPGGRGYSLKVLPYDTRQKLWVSITDQSAIIKMLETRDELTYDMPEVHVTNTVTGYSTATTIQFSPPDMITGNQLIGSLNINPDSGEILSINVIQTGTGYLYHPTYRLNDPLNPKNNNLQELQLLVEIDRASATTVTNTYDRGSIVIPKSRFQQAPGMDHQTLWGFETTYAKVENNSPKDTKANFNNITYINKVPVQPIDNQYQLWSFAKPYPIFPITGQIPGIDLESDKGWNGISDIPLFYIFVHNKNFDSMRELTYRFNYGNSTATDVIIGPSARDFISTVTDISFTDLIEPIYVSTTADPVAAGNPVPVYVKTAPYMDSIYVNQVCGIPDRTKVTLTNGTGTFNILTTTLQPGEVASAKVGFKHWFNTDTITKTLS